MSNPITFSAPAIAVSHSIVQAASVDPRQEPDDHLYRRLTAKTRDLQPFQHSRIVDLSFWLWQRNPLGNRIIEIMKDYTVNDDLRVDVLIMKRHGAQAVVDEDTEREDGQRVWDDFCSDSHNRFWERLGLLVRDFLLYGELLIPVEVNPMNGFVRYGYIDTTLIRQILMESSGLDVDIIKFTAPGTSDEIGKKIIRPDVDPKSSTYQKLIGDAFFFRMNHVMNQSRGHGELTQSLDWIDALDQFMFNTLEGFTLRNAFFYDAEYTGATEEELKGKEIAPPKPGTVKIHNEKVKWNVVTPDLKSADSSEAVRLFKSFILAGKGYPSHWFGEGEDTNRATAQSMTVPTMQMLKSKQKEIKKMVEMISRFVLDQAIIAGSLKLGTDEYVDVRISCYDISRQDAQTVAVAFGAFMNALSVAVDRGWVSDDNAKKVVDGHLQQVGVDVDPNETVASLKSNQLDKMTGDIYAQ